MNIADRMEKIAPFYVMELLERAKELEATGHTIIHMEVGEPGFALPKVVKQAGVDALAADETGYTPAAGLPQLRQAVAASYRQFGAEVAPEQVIITTGSSGALQLIIGAAVNPGGEILMADPSYPCNKHFAVTFGAVPRLLPVGAETNYQLTAAMVEKVWNSRSEAVMVASPSNPTGTLLPQAELAALTKTTESLGGLLIVDEIYHRLVFDCEPTTALALSDRTVVLNSFSKYHGMTGLRIGWMVVPEQLVDPINRLAQNLFISAPVPAQQMALRALEADCTAIFEERRQLFRQRRELLLPELRRLGFSIPVNPEGAFYIYADCSAFTDDSMAFCHRLLEEAGVAITPGLDFGHNTPERYVRFAYTGDEKEIQEALQRLEKFLG